MPFVKLQSNVELDETKRQDLLKQVSSLAAKQLGKPESYVMVAMEPTTPMLFAGNNDPLCYVELKSISLPETKTAEISAALCTLIAEQINIAQDRIYIEFSDAPRAMWGWNGGTF